MPRVLLGTMEIANQISTTSALLRSQGVECLGVNYYPTYLRYACDFEMEFPIATDPRTAHGLAKQVGGELIGRFDIYHFHFGTSLHLDNSDLSQIKASGGRIVMQHHGSEVRTLEKARKHSPDVRVKPGLSDRAHELLSHLSEFIDDTIVWDFELYQYVKDYYPRVHFLHQALDLASSAPPPNPEFNKERPLLVHAPTSRDVKGTDFILESIDALRGDFDFDFRLIEGLSHEEAIKIYRRADLVIDQVLIGSMGVLSLEAMALGRPVACFINELASSFYPSDLPVININRHTLTESLAFVLRNRDMLPELGQRGRKYVEKYHNAHRVTDELLSIYRSLG